MDLPARYRVERRVGAGAVAEVYAVVDRVLGERRLALKKLRSDACTVPQANRLKAEFQFLTRARHPNLVRAYDLGFAGEAQELYFTEDLIEGVDLVTACNQAELPQIAEWFEQCCLALHFLHTAGLVHGDVKPQHMLVHPAAVQPTEAVKLIDLGMAERWQESPRLLSGGTLPYVAPEVAHGHPADPRSDMYSLGMTLFQVLGRRVFGEDVRAGAGTVGARLDEMVSRGLPEPLGRLVFRMTTTAMADRYPDLQDVYRVLHDLARPGKPRRLWEQFAIVPAATPGHVLGRDGLRRSLQDAVYRFRRGDLEWNCLMIPGEMGLGKSQLAEELRLSAQMAGIPVAKVSFGPVRTSTYAPFEDALCGVGEALGGGDRGMGDTWSTVPADTSPGPDDILSDESEDVRRKWQGLASRVRTVCSRARSLLIFEDIHAADGEALGLIGYLVRSLPPRDCLVCCTYRPEEGNGKQAADLAGELGAQGHVSVTKLSPLSPLSVQQMAQTFLGAIRVDRETGEHLHATCAGNPLYLRHVMAHFLEQLPSEPITREDVCPLLRQARIPQSLQNVVLQRVSGLNEPERLCLAALAVLGRPGTLNEIGRVLDVPVEECRHALMSLSASGLIRPPSSAGGCYELEHPVFRGAALHRWPPDAQRPFHFRAGEIAERRWLAGETSSLEEAAEHFLKAGAEEKAAAYCLESARVSVRSYSYERATRLYEDALRRLRGGSEAYLTAGEECALAWACLGHYAKAIRWYETLLQFPLDDAKRGNLLRKLGESRVHCRDFPAALTALDESGKCLARFPETQAALRLRLTVLRAWMATGRHAEALRGFLGLATTGSGLGPGDHGRLCQYIGQSLCFLGEYEKAWEWAQRSLQVFRETSDPLNEGRANRTLGNIAYSLGRFGEALSFYEEAVRVQRPFGVARETAVSLRCSANLAFVQAELGTSLRRNREALYVYRKSGTDRDVTETLTSLALTYIHLGQFELAGETIRDAITRSRDTPTPTRLFALVTQAELELTVGDTSGAAEVIETMRDVLASPAHPPWAEALFSHLAGWHGCESGDMERGIALLRRALDQATAQKRRSDASCISLTLARYLSMRGSQVLPLLQQIQVETQKMGHRLWEGVALFLEGQARCRQEDLQGSLSPLLRCLDMCRSCGMKDLGWSVRAVLADAQFRLGRLRYAKSYDLESIEILRELRRQFGSEDAWRRFLKVPSRAALYGGIARRLQARYTLAEAP